MMSRWKLVASLAIATLVLAPSAHAQVIYDNGVLNSEADFSLGSDAGIPQRMADTFILEATATFNQVRFLGTYNDNNTTTDLFVFDFYDTTAGTPNTNALPVGPIILNNVIRNNTGFDT